MIYPLTLSYFPKWKAVLEVQPVVIGKAPQRSAELALIAAAQESTGNFYYHLEAEDNWLTPAELAYEERGDCEDFAIYRYYKLLEAGFTAAEIVVGELLPHRLMHAICVAHASNGTAYALCNTKQHAEEWALYSRYFKPIFALSTEGGRFWDGE